MNQCLRKSIVLLPFLLPATAGTLDAAEPVVTENNALQRRVVHELRSEIEDWDCAEQKTQEQVGQLPGAWMAMGGRAVYAGKALQYPPEWFVATDIERPLIRRGLVPSYVDGLEPISDDGNVLVIAIHYASDANQKDTVLAEPESLLQQPLTHSPFVSPTLDHRTCVWYVRNTSTASKSTATVHLRCRVRQKATGIVFDLIATEEYVYSPTPELGKKCWQRGKTAHMLFSRPTLADDIGNSGDTNRF